MLLLITFFLNVKLGIVIRIPKENKENRFLKDLLLFWMSYIKLHYVLLRNCEKIEKVYLY
jgi:hypothetical protein